MTTLPGPSTTAGPTRLLDRDTHIALIDEHLAAVSRTGRGRVVLIGGEAGTGKTALIKTICSGQPPSVAILSGACDPLLTPRPLGPIHDIAQVIGGDLEHLTEGGARPYEIATSLLRALRPGRPTILAVEDLHWADEATLDVLRLLARRIDTVPVVVLASYRDDELDRSHPLRVLLGELATTELVVRIRLGGLSFAAVAELSHSSDIDTLELYRKTGGNAFFVTEALSAGLHPIPPTVRDAVLARAARLSPGAMKLLEWVAVLPPHADTWVLEALAPDALHVLEECLASGMLMVTGHAVAFRHELARLAIEESLTPLRHIALHRQALRVLASPPFGSPDLARLAHHAEAAEDADAVLRYAPQAAAQATGVAAHREAAAQYARAIRFSGSLPPVDRGELLERQAHEYYLTAQHEPCIDAANGALDAYRQAGDRLREGAALCALARYLWCFASTAEADRAAGQAVALFEQLPSPGSDVVLERETGRAYATLASVRMNADDADATIELGRKAIAIAERLNDTQAVVYTLNTLGTNEMLAGSAAGVEKLLRSLELARESGLDEYVGRAYIHLAWAGSRTRSLLQLESTLREGMDFAVTHALELWRHHLVVFSARLALDRGSWSDAVELASGLLRNPQILNPRVAALIVVGLVRARRGDPECWRPLDQAFAHAERTGLLQFTGPVAAARAEAAWLQGQPELVAEVTNAAFDLARQRRASWVLGELAVWRWRAGVRDTLDLDAVAEPYALELRGYWRAAAEFWTQRGCPYEAALALASGDSADALRNALDELQRLGASSALSIVARRLRESGVRGVPRGPRAATRSNAAHLTGRQLEIVGLLAQGLRNAEIAERLYLSAKTVDHHVSAILEKLDARSRTEASQKAVQLGIVSNEGP